MGLRTGLPCDLAVGSKGAAFKSEVLGALSRCLLASAASGVTVMLGHPLSGVGCWPAASSALPSACWCTSCTARLCNASNMVCAAACHLACSCDWITCSRGRTSA